MTIKAPTMAAMALFASLPCAAPAVAQDLGPNVRKLADGVYAFVGENYNSNAGIVLTQDGVVLIDSGHNPVESRKLMEVVKKLTPMPVRLLIDTEPHPDHTTGHFVFSPPASIVAAAPDLADLEQKLLEAGCDPQDVVFEQLWADDHSTGGVELL